MKIVCEGTVVNNGIFIPSGVTIDVVVNNSSSLTSFPDVGIEFQKKFRAEWDERENKIEKIFNI